MYKEMNKLTKKQYVQLVATSLNETYGNTLVEDDTDIQMAEMVVEQLNNHLYFRKETKESTKKYYEWKKAR